MSRDHSQNHYGPNASFDGYDSDLASAGILIESLRQQLAGAASRNAEVQRLQSALADAEALELGTAERCDQLRAHINDLRDAFQTFIDEHEECAILTRSNRQKLDGTRLAR